MSAAVKPQRRVVDGPSQFINRSLSDVRFCSHTYYLVGIEFRWRFPLTFQVVSTSRVHLLNGVAVCNVETVMRPIAWERLAVAWLANLLPVFIRKCWITVSLNTL